MNPSGRPQREQPDCRVTRTEAETIHLFRGADVDLIGPLLDRCPVRQLAPREVLIAEGEMDRVVYVLLDGQLEVRLDPHSEDVVATIEPGHAVGELAPIDHRPRSATIVAATSCRVLEVTEETFWDLLRTSHAFALNILTMLCDRLRGINVSLTESRRLQRVFARQASIDPLTEVGNRRWLDELLDRQVRRHTVSGTLLSVIMLDIDHFKQCNDRFGHSAGDSVLTNVAQVLTSQFRPSDFVARYGGEEFTVVLPATGLAGAVRAGDRVRQTVAETHFIGPDGVQVIPITISLGVAELRPGETAEALVARADQALYRAKREGRNRVCSSEPNATESNERSDG